MQYYRKNIFKFLTSSEKSINFFQNLLSSFLFDRGYGYTLDSSVENLNEDSEFFIIKIYLGDNIIQHTFFVEVTYKDILCFNIKSYKENKTYNRTISSDITDDFLRILSSVNLRRKIKLSLLTQ